MIIEFKGKTFKVFRHTLGASSIRLGDFVSTGGIMARIVSISRGCPSINKYGDGFTIILLDNGTKLSTIRPDMKSPVEIWRGKKIN